MSIRSIFVAVSLSVLVVAALTADAEQPSGGACPGALARIVFRDYGGDNPLQMCIAANGLNISAGIVTLQVYDRYSDGIFHNGVDGAQ
jgi:hypothetical protein